MAIAFRLPAALTKSRESGLCLTRNAPREVENGGVSRRRDAGVAARGTGRAVRAVRPRAEPGLHGLLGQITLLNRHRPIRIGPSLGREIS